MKIIGFAFKNNISENVLKQLPLSEKYYLESTEVEIRDFVKTLVKTSPEYVLGLGMYSGRDTDFLRIETVCKNKFRNSKINSAGLDEYRIEPFLAASSHSKVTAGLGNSYCNLVSYLIKTSSSFPYTFIHIPRTFSLELATSVINTIG
jgi:hypothetical protein